MPNIRQMVNMLEGYGTSEGATKAWESRGRGEQRQAGDRRTGRRVWVPRERRTGEARRQVREAMRQEQERKVLNRVVQERQRVRRSL